MPIPSGLGTTWGFSAAESSYATPATADRFYEINSHTLDYNKTVVQGGGLRGSGLYGRQSRRTVTLKSASGDVPMDLPSKGINRLLQAWSGSTAAPVQIASTTAYKSIHTPQVALSSYTLRSGLARAVAAGTRDVYLFAGSMVTQWQLGCNAGEIAVCTTSWDCQNVTRAAESSDISTYSPANVFHFLEGTLTLGGTVSTGSGLVSVSGGTAVAAVTGATVTGVNGIKVDRNFYNSGGLKAQPLRNNWGAVTGSLTAEYTDATIVDANLADTPMALELKFVGPQIASTGQYETFDLIIPSITFNGELPKPSGPDVLTITAPFDGLDDGTNAVYQFVTIGTDTAA
jgi:hypothetical protein